MNTLRDDELGEFRLDRRTGWWATKLEIEPGNKIDVTLSPDEHEIGPLLEMARSVVRVLRNEPDRYRRAAADQMLNLYNDNWRFKDEEDPIDADTFISRLSLQGVHVIHESEVMADVAYEADEMFADHGVRLWIAADGSVTDVRAE